MTGQFGGKKSSDGRTVLDGDETKTHVGLKWHRRVNASHLHPCLRQVDPQGQLLPCEDVWVVGLGEGFLQGLELKTTTAGCRARHKCGPDTAVSYIVAYGSCWSGYNRETCAMNVHQPLSRNK